MYQISSCGGGDVEGGGGGATIAILPRPLPVFGAL